MNALLARLRPHARTGLAIAIGAVIGAGYSLTVGCPTGGCALTSNPWIAAVFGGVIGSLWVGPARRG